MPLNELMSLYDAVVVATGCDLPRSLDLPGAELDGVVNARAFVGWYNAEPTFSGLELPEVTDQLRTVIIGHGNVALDCARVIAAPSTHLGRDRHARGGLRGVAEGAPIEAPYTRRRAARRDAGGLYDQRMSRAHGATKMPPWSSTPRN